MAFRNSKAKPTPEELDESGAFKKIQDLDHNEMVPFLLDNLKNRNPINATFKHGTMLLIALILFVWIGRWDGTDFFIGLGAGIFFTFTIGLIFHELLHLLVYKVLGAKKTKLKPLWDQGAVAAVADKFVVAENRPRRSGGAAAGWRGRRGRSAARGSPSLDPGCLTGIRIAGSSRGRRTGFFTPSHFSWCFTPPHALVTSPWPAISTKTATGKSTPMMM